MFIHLILIPIYLAVRIKQNVVTPRVRAHESYLLRRELELEFNINNKFYTEKIYLFSLFRRRQGIHLNDFTTMSTVVFKSSTTSSDYLENNSGRLKIVGDVDNTVEDLS